MPRFVKTLILWLGLIIAFVALYNVFSKEPSASAPSGAERGLGAWSIVANLPLLALAVAVFVAVFVLRQRGASRLNQDGVALLGQGRYSAALEKFEAYLARRKGDFTGLFNVGVAHLALWQLERAAEHFDRAANTKQYVLIGTPHAELVRYTRSNLALVQALQGNTNGAREALEALAGGKDPLLASALLARAVLACRAGDWAQARSILLQHEVQQLGGQQRALSDTLLSWAAERLGGQPLPLKKAALYGETGPEQVRAAWPELVDFVDRAPAV